MTMTINMNFKYKVGEVDVDLTLSGESAEEVKGAANKFGIGFEVDHEDSAPEPEPVYEEAAPAEAERVMYFKRDATDEVIRVARGESLEFLDGPEVFEEVSRKEFNEYKKSLEASDPEEWKDSEPEPEEEPEKKPEVKPEVKPEPADQKAELQHLATTAIKAGKKAEVKAALESVGAKRLSDVAEDDYSVVSDQLRALV